MKLITNFAILFLVISSCKNNQRITNVSLEIDHLLIVDSLGLFSESDFLKERLSTDTLLVDYTTLNTKVFRKKYKLNKNQMSYVNRSMLATVKMCKLRASIDEFREQRTNIIHKWDTTSVKFKEMQHKMDSINLPNGEPFLEKVIFVDSLINSYNALIKLDSILRKDTINSPR